MSGGDASGTPNPLRSPGAALLDLHTHSYERSLDSGVSAAHLAMRAKEAGLSGICLTDHNAVCAPDEAAALAERFELAVIPGMEVGTDIGHVLVFGLQRFHPELVHIRQLRRIAIAEGAAMIWAHPMRELAVRRLDWEELPELFEGLEVVNGDHTDGVDGYFAELARGFGLGMTAGSDAHSAQAIGRVATAFSRPVGDLESLLAALHRRDHVVLDMRAPRPDPGGCG